jgi:hypothetical protein
LKLVVGAVDARATGQEQEELGGRVWVVGGFGDVDFDVVKFGDFLFFLSFLLFPRVYRGGFVHLWVSRRPLQARQPALLLSSSREALEGSRVGLSVTQCSCVEFSM